ncbi:MAG: biopolymer transporter ExbD [Labilithrix sp.]|nr:biopolymer transporter ExbD [Labilithrix sp.]
MAGASQKGDGGLMTEINVTPLVDVVLVLLVLMMVTATSLAQKTIQVELPKARSGDADSAKKPLMVAVDESGALYVDADRLDEPGVRARAREAVARDADVSAVLAADGRARHEVVVHALELLRGERVAKIAIVVRAEGAP